MDFDPFFGISGYSLKPPFKAEVVTSRIHRRSKGESGASANGW